MLDPKFKLPVLDADLDDAALGKLAEQKLFRQRFLDLFLDHAGKRPCAHLVVIALVGQPFGGRTRQLDMNTAVHELGFQLQHELFDDLQNDLFRQRAEADHRIEAVAELGRKGPLDGGRILALAPVTTEADSGLGHFRGPGVRGHDQDDVPEIDLPPVVVGQLAVVHHLQQDVEHVRVRLLDLVEQKHAMRMLIDPVGQKTALIEPDIARRRADQAADGACFSMYSDMSKRISSTPSVSASCLATSVLPTPVGPANR